MERSQIQHGYDNDGELILTGSSNAYVAATARAISGYFQGLRVCGKANHTNTGASTLEVFGPNSSTGLGAKAIRKLASTALVAGDIVSGQYYDFVFDATNDRWLLLNPSTVSAVGGLTFSASGDRWGVIPFVAADGVMEVGRYIDFHNSDGDTSDNILRIEPADGSALFFTPTVGGTAGQLRRVASLDNATASDGDMIYYSSGTFTRLAAGLSGQFLKTFGAASNPAWVYPITVADVQATTSGTAFDFTGLPADISRITVNFSGVSLSGTNQILVQIGDAGGIETTGYASASNDSAAASTSTAGFIIRTDVAADAVSGAMILTKMDTNTWTSMHGVVRAGNNISSSGGGGKTLSAGPLTQVRVTRSGADTFDAGSVNIVYD